eukprot:7065870-Prymnesium_polylepis.1
MGLPGLECRMPLIVSAALSGKLSGLEQVVRVGCTNPAKLYGLYPRKGTLCVGSDADIVLWDAAAERVIRKEALHDDLDYTPYEGIKLRGAVVRTLLRGRTVYARGAPDAVSAVRGGGQFVASGKPDLLGWGGVFPDTADVVEQSAFALLGPALDCESAASDTDEAETRKRARREEEEEE